jgi:ferredoxin
LKYAIDAENCLYFTKGKCGICQKICPAQSIDRGLNRKQAITLKHCTDAQMLAKIDALLEPTDPSFPFPI